MNRIVSVSGGQSSAYTAANYPSDHLLFSLVCIEDPASSPKDKGLIQIVSDRIGKEFIATSEDDTIIYTLLDLEQYLGRSINWVAGKTFDQVIEKKGGYLPNKMQRYCTVEMKLRPMHRWWRSNINEPVEMLIGFRAGEEARAKRMLERTNSDGLLEFKDIVGKHASGKNKWAETPWQKPVFPMIQDGVRRDKVVEFWKDKPVRFAERNNCVGCFHRNPILIRSIWDKHPEKLEWFASKERKEKPAQWRSDMKYDDIKKHRLQHALNFEDFGDCDSGHCGL